MGEEMAVGDPREVEKVGKWVRELRPRQRQLPLRHLGPPPESSTSPSFLSVVWKWQLVRDLGEARTLALAFLYCPTLVCENVSQNWNSTLERSLWSSDVKLREWSCLRCKLLYPSRLLTDVLGLFYSWQVQVSNFPLDFLIFSDPHSLYAFLFMYMCLQLKPEFAHQHLMVQMLVLLALMIWLNHQIFFAKN